jgi:hypothetical protein
MSEEGLSKEAQGIMEKWNDGIMRKELLQVADFRIDSRSRIFR